MAARIRFWKSQQMVLQTAASIICVYRGAFSFLEIVALRMRPFGTRPWNFRLVLQTSDGIALHSPANCNFRSFSRQPMVIWGLSPDHRQWEPFRNVSI
jgi:hypothetical protein